MSFFYLNQRYGITISCVNVYWLDLFLRWVTWPILHLPQKPLGQFHLIMAKSILQWRGYICRTIQDDDFNSFLFSLGLYTGIIKNFLKSVYGWKMFPRWAVWPMGLLFKWCAFDIHFHFFFYYFFFSAMSLWYAVY